MGSFLCLTPTSYCQENSHSEVAASMLVDIETRLQKGQVLAIRDLASLWQVQPDNQTYKYLAQKYLSLLPTELDWLAADLPQQLMRLFYEKEEAWQFSEFLTIFYLTPIEQRLDEAKLKEWHPPTFNLFVAEKIIQNMMGILEDKKYPALKESISTLSYLEQAASDQVALTLVQHRKFLKIKPEALRLEILQHTIEAISNEKAIQIIFNLLEQRAIPTHFGKTLLANLTNYNFKDVPADSIKLKWLSVLAANKNNPELIRKKTYKEVLSFKPSFFEEPVDYYAWTLATTSKDSLSWIHYNALKDMLDTRHPKLLFYLAGLQYRHWKSSDTDHYLKALNQVVDVRVAVKNQAGQLTYEYTDSVAQLNFLIYWSKHYDDYEWSEKPVGLFMNRRLKSDLVDTYEKHFRRLNSSNDSVARTSFLALTEGLPDEVNRLMKKYRTLLRTYNAQLPPLKFSIIENISYLTAYCRQHEFEYLPTPEFSKQLTKLSNDLSAKERLLVENHLIKTLKLEDLTILEYFAATRADHIQLNYSIGRVIDYLYAKYWSSIVQDEQQLRLYLLKNTIYKKLTNFGLARLFHHRILSSSDQLKILLQDIEQSERNELILQAIVSARKGQLSPNALTVEDFLADPISFNEEEILQLSPLRSSEFRFYFQTLLKERNRKALKKMEKYLSTFASIDLVPTIFNYSQEDWLANKSAAKVMVRILQQIYGYTFSKDTATSIEKWYQLWESKEETYADWGKFLFDLQLTELAEQPTLRVANINSIAESKYYQPKYRTDCLIALKKLKKVRTITQLRLQPLLIASKELSYLRVLDFSHRDLENFTKILEIDEPDSLLHFILQKSEHFSVDHKGFLFNNLLRQNWLYYLVNNRQMKEKHVYILLENLITYLNESIYLTEFEEQNTQLNILLLTHYQSDLASKLAVLDDLAYDESVRLKWLEIILARITYEDLPNVLTTRTVIKDFDETSLFRFISRDFGFPIYNWEEPKVIATFEQRIQSLSKLDLYKLYIKEFGIDITTSKGKLDFRKIYRLLQFDLVVPFIGDGGQYRDTYIYALLKILELHFNTTLDFSPKLNEYQTFFQFNSFARVKAWKKYLVKHKYVKESSDLRLSFKGE